MNLQTSQILKLITITFMLISVFVLGYVGWRDRQPIIEKLTGPKVRATATRVPNPSEETISIFTKFVDSRSWIEGINMVKVDFNQNVRQSTFRYFKSSPVTEAWNAQKLNYAPLFGNVEATNQKIVNLINGISYCTTIQETTAGRIIPNLQNYASHVCAVPIPPGYGDFIGFMVLFLKKELTLSEQTSFLKEVEKLSVEMYERDVVKSHRKFNELGSSNTIR